MPLNGLFAFHPVTLLLSILFVDCCMFSCSIAQSTSDVEPPPAANRTNQLISWCTSFFPVLLIFSLNLCQLCTSMFASALSAYLGQIPNHWHTSSNYDSRIGGQLRAIAMFGGVDDEGRVLSHQRRRQGWRQWEGLRGWMACSDLMKQWLIDQWIATEEAASV